MKKLILTFLILIMCMAGAMTAGAASDPQATDNANSWRYENGQLKQTEKFRSAEGFGFAAEEITHPDGTLKGIDVSKHQGVIDWEKVKASGVDFVIIRCGYGLDKPEWDDPQFQRNADECERLGIPYGVYFYSYANDVEDAISEAEHALRLIKDRNLSYPVYFDMEDKSTLIGKTTEEQAANLALFAKTFCGKITAAGYPVGIYANTNWFNTYLTDECFDQWPKWVAQYNTECKYEGEYAMWQYTSDGTVDGIAGRVDMNWQIGHPADHGHAFEAELVSAVEPTAEADGNIEHYKCKHCGILYADKDGLKKLTEDDVIVRFDVLFNGGETARFAGNDRYQTALVSADALKLQNRLTHFENIIVASGSNYPDALAGSYLAKAKEAPILLVGTDTASQEKTAEYITENLKKDGTVYILGGTVAVAADFESKLTAENIRTERLAGNDRYATNIAILKAAGVEKTDILICSGGGFADSLSGSAVGLPVLLVGSKVTADQQSYLDTLDVEKMYLIGGENAVNGNIETYLKTKYSLKRLAGKNRYETSAMIAEEFFPKVQTAVTAYGLNFPDGLSGGPLAMALEAPMILITDSECAEASAYVKNSGVERVAIMGGTTLISDQAVIDLLK
ncbi:MAG: cell wall-binding repeat-containing protein [Firmicutes bacterium]|nr:cell wall-binding repeat-containing protein [Bacillota bacterium]